MCFFFAQWFSSGPPAPHNTRPAHPPTHNARAPPPPPPPPHSLRYVCYLAFQLHTHHSLFQGEDDGEAEEPVLSLPAALLMLAGVTALVAACSELLTGSIEEFSAQTGLGQAFVGMIVLPIAGAPRCVCVCACARARASDDDDA